MKRIWFTQQKQYDYMPLRAGLGLVTQDELFDYYSSESLVQLCPKIYTTRIRALSGEYCVVEGSRYKAKPVEPMIDFQVMQTWELSFKNNLISPWYLEKDGFTFPELDLGIRNSSFGDLINELRQLYKKATIYTPFYINLLEPINALSELSLRIKS